MSTLSLTFDTLSAEVKFMKNCVKISSNDKLKCYFDGIKYIFDKGYSQSDSNEHTITLEAIDRVKDNLTSTPENDAYRFFSTDGRKNCFSPSLEENDKSFSSTDINKLRISCSDLSKIKCSNIDVDQSEILILGSSEIELMN